MCNNHQMFQDDQIGDEMDKQCGLHGRKNELLQVLKGKL